MGHVRLDKLLIADGEFTCTSDAAWTKQNGELIELAIVPIDLKTLEIRRDLAWSSLIKPVKTEITAYCTELTGITAEMIRSEAKPVNEVFNTIDKLFGHGAPWGTWGETDREVIQRAADLAGVRFPMSSTHLNLKFHYSLYRNRRREIGFKKALQAERIQFVGEPHRAGPDTENLAVLWQKILREIRSLSQR